MKITFIGIGKMGAAMVERLLKAGHQITVYNRTLSKAQPLVDQGALLANNLDEAVSKADIIMSCLLNDEALLATTQDMLTFMPNGNKTIHVCLATVLPETAKTMTKLHSDHGSIYISATVLGVPKVVTKGELTCFIAGDQNAIETLKPLLKSFCAKIVELGEQIDAPNIMKVCMNYSLITAIELLGELYSFADKSGLDTELVRGAMHQVFGHPAFKLYVDKIHDKDFDNVNFDMIGGNKDTALFQEAFKQVGANPAIANLVKTRFDKALEQGMADKDWSGIAEIIFNEK